MGEMESLRRYYNVPAKRGARVICTWPRPRPGTIMSAREHKLYIRFDDTGRREGPYHPTWEMQYV
jgi:hypothetical protein